MYSYNVVILGGSTGLGKCIASELINEKNFKITIVGLHKPKKTKLNLKFLKCDLQKIRRLKDCIKTINKENKKIDILILNSGSFFLNKEIVEKKYEKTFLVNFLTQFYLILHLKKKILNSDLKKIFIISSHVISRSKLNISDIQSLNKFNFWDSYKNSKLLLFLICKHFFINDKKKISYFFFNPGRINTNLGSNLKLIGNLINLYHKFLGKKPEYISKIFIKYIKENIYKHNIFKFKDFQNKTVVTKKIEKKFNKKKLIQNVFQLSKNF